MKITTEHPFSCYVIPILNGRELDNCFDLDTDENKVTLLSLNNPTVKTVKSGIVTFKLKASAERFKEQITDLTRDHGFMGFEH